MKRIYLLLSIVLSFVFTYGQAPASAEVQFEYSYKGFSGDELDYLPKKVTALVSGNNVKKIMIDSVSISEVLFNGDSLFMAELMEIDDEKMGMIYHRDDIETLTADFTIKVKKKKKYKLILDCLCYEYEVTIIDKETNEKMKEELYATREIGGERLNFVFYNGVEGFILESKKYISDTQTVTLKAVKLNKKSIPYSEFLVSDEYDITTYKQQLKEK